MKRYSVDTSYGECAVGFVADDHDGDYVEFEPWMATVTATELAELRRDAERLDWMVAEGAACGDTSRGGFSCHYGEHSDVAYGDTARDAIDSARGAK